LLIHCGLQAHYAKTPVGQHSRRNHTPGPAAPRAQVSQHLHPLLTRHPTVALVAPMPVEPTRPTTLRALPRRLRTPLTLQTAFEYLHPRKYRKPTPIQKKSAPPQNRPADGRPTPLQPSRLRLEGFRSVGLPSAAPPPRSGRAPHTLPHKSSRFTPHPIHRVYRGAPHQRAASWPPGASSVFTVEG
jgi:hypothetical protein